MELYGERVKKFGKRKADWKFAVDVLLLFRPGIVKKMERYQRVNNYGMYKNYLKVSYRVFNRERMYGLINVSGLAIGFTCCLLIFLFIRDELSYDDFHQDNDQIYRVASAYMRQGKWEPYSSNSWRTAELLQANFGEIKQMVRIRDDDEVFEYEDKKIIERRVAYVDDNFFDVFNFSLVEGNPAEALKGTNKVVISESTATKYFGTETAMGKVFEAGDGAFQLQVSGVMKDMPSNSHFHFDFLIAGETQRQVSPPELFTNVGWDSQYVYIKTEPGVDPTAIETRFPDFINDNLGIFNANNFKLFLQPLSSIHLESNNGLEIEPNGSIKNVYIFSVIAVFILFIACINYMNLTTARSLRRAKEVGMRKVLGAKRADLVNQFLTESGMMTFLAVVIAFGVSILFLEQFNQFAGKAISPQMLFRPEIIVILLVAFLVVAFVSGSYPSLILSSFKPLNNMKTGSNRGKSGFVFRKGLVVLQFVISIGLIAATVIVFQQWSFLKTKELGINKENIITIPLQTMDRVQLDVFKNQLFKNPSIKNVGTSNMKMPGWIFNSTPYFAQDEVVDQEESLHREIPPTIFIPSTDWLDYAYVRIGNESMEASLEHIEKVYSTFVTNRDFSYTFMNEDMEQQYIAEEKFAQIFSIFTVLAIFIACLGTFGLISFAAERKSKEIGIRKVLGASSGSVTFLLVREFVILLLLASCIAWPVVWYFLNNWIESFIYRTSIGTGPFIIATLLATCIVVATTGFRAMKAALANPIDSLRNE
jgi:putative ABC transport system permease protein